MRNHALLLSILLSILVSIPTLGGCTEREPVEDDRDTPSCGEIATAMVDACADAFAELSQCLEAVDPSMCDPQNLAHGRCIEMAEGDIDVEAHDAAFSRYLCEVASMPSEDCEQRIAACE